MKSITLAIGLAITTSSGMVQAASHEHDMSQQQITMQPAVKQEGVGVLKAINAKDNKVQIAHEAIAALGWPSMTMWFAVRPPLSGEFKVGDAVIFEMMENDKKQWVIVKIARK